MWGQMTLPGAPSYWGSPARPHLSMALPGVMGLRVTPAKLQVNTPHRGLSRPPPLQVISPSSVGAHTRSDRHRASRRIPNRRSPMAFSQTSGGTHVRA